METAKIIDDYTLETQASVNKRFAIHKDGIYFAHQPIYGYRSPYADVSNISRYMVTLSILKTLNEYYFENFVDIGGAEGYTANLVGTLFKAKVKSTDLSENACKMAKSIFNIEAIACDIHQLPFANQEFEAVLCSETIEHVTDYKKAIQELLRVTDKVLVITVPHETLEIVAENIKNKVPHGHIHYFDTQTLDYLKAEGYTVKFKKSLSPFLIIPRVFAEGIPKKSNKIHYKIYNQLIPVLRKIFGIRTANFLANLDMVLCEFTGAYGGITFTIEKKGVVHERQLNKLNAEDFTNIKVNFFYT